MSETSGPSFIGLTFSTASAAQALDQVFAAIDAPFSYVVTPNVDHVVQLNGAPGATTAAFAAAYADAMLVLCDSRVLARLGRLSGRRLAVVPGSDLTAALLADARLAGRRVAIVGGSAALVPALQRRVLGVTFVQHRPPMGVLTNAVAAAEIKRFVASAQADLTLFAIGSPQSEIMAHQCRLAGRSHGVGLCIGASLEFVVGEKRRAPRSIQRAGFEWAFRLASEPRRLWRRYMVDGPRVFVIWWRRGRN